MKSKCKNLTERIRIDRDRNGITIWFDDLWIIDASTILEDGTFSISPKCKKYKDIEDKRNKHYVIRGK